jgi:hypothetical protein
VVEVVLAELVEDIMVGADLLIQVFLVIIQVEEEVVVMEEGVVVRVHIQDKMSEVGVLEDLLHLELVLLLAQLLMLWILLLPVMVK